MAGLFGITTKGPPEPIRSVKIATDGYIFHQIPDEEYVGAFNRFLLGANSQVAATLEVDGMSTVLRASLGDMLKDILGRQPKKHELDAWFTHHDFDRSGLLSIEEYFQGVDKLRALSADPKEPCEYISYDQHRKDWLRHTRVGYEPQTTLTGPLTTSQQVGWHVHKPAPTEPNFACNRTDVTIKEGRDAKSYYGHFNV